MSNFGLILILSTAASQIIGTRGTVIRGDEKPGQQCVIQKGIKGRCEKISSCVSNNGVLKHENVTKMCAPQNNEEYVCCRRPFSIAKQVCDAWKSYWLDNNGRCVARTPTVVGGEDAEIGQFPEIALVGVGENLNRIQWDCGGTLISPLFILTAAHCVKHLEQYIVKLGDHNLEDDELDNITRVVGPVPTGLLGENLLHFETRLQATTEQSVLVEDIVIHPEYDGRYNDIALIKLKKPVVLTKRVLPACLPTDPNEDYNEFNLTVAGWGRTQIDVFELSETLQKVTIPVIPRTKCWTEMERLNPFLIPKGITKELLCAGQENKDSCKGDSGGPLIHPTRDESSGVACEHTVTGIVSFGNGCGSFGVYTRVSSYVDWITSYIAPGVVPRI